MKPLTPRQIKAAGIVIAILAVIHFAPSVLRAGLLATIAPHQPSAMPVKPVPAPLAAPPPPASKPVGLTPLQQVTFLGIWEGGQLNADNDQCRIRLELRLRPDQPDHVLGYESRTCFNIDKYTLQPNLKGGGLAGAIRANTPVATVMTGTYEDGSITFQVDKTVGSSPFVCPLASYAVTPFGQRAIVAQWRAESCPAGQIVLARTGV